jgi:hypothetical protein
VVSFLEKKFTEENVAILILRHVLVEKRYNFVRHFLNCCIKMRHFIDDTAVLAIYGKILRGNWRFSESAFIISIQEQNIETFEFLFSALIEFSDKQEKTAVKSMLQTEESIISEYFQRMDDERFNILEKLKSKFKVDFVKKLIQMTYYHNRTRDNLLLLASSKGSNCVRIIKWVKINVKDDRFMRNILISTDNFKRGLLHKIMYDYNETNRHEKITLFFEVIDSISDIKKSTYKEVLNMKDNNSYNLLHWLDIKNVESAYKIRFNRASRQAT